MLFYLKIFAKNAFCSLVFEQ